MKPVVRVTLLAALLSLIALLGLGFVITRSAFQTWIAEGRLPEGSSLESIKIGTGKIKVDGLLIPLDGGSALVLDSATIDYSLGALLFSQTLRSERIDVTGLRYALGVESGADELEAHRSVDAAEGDRPGDNWLDPLYDLAKGHWRFEIGEVSVDGEVADAAGREVGFRIVGGGLNPGETGRFAFDSRFSGVPVEGIGPTDFSAGAVLLLRQNADGGFDRLEVEAHAAGRDPRGGAQLDLEKRLQLEIDPVGKSAQFSFSYILDWPHPEVLDPALAPLGGVSLRLEGAGETDGGQLRIQSLAAAGASRDLPVLDARLLQTLELGGETNISGELLRLTLQDLPLSWLKPWLPDGMVTEGGPVSAGFSLSRTESGSIRIQPVDACFIGPVSLSIPGEALLDSVQVASLPQAEIFMDGRIRLQLTDVQIDGATGPLVSASAEANIQKGMSAGRVEASFDGFLPALLAQPMANGIASLADGAITGSVAMEWGTGTSARSVMNLSRLRPLGSDVFLSDIGIALKANKAEGDILYLQASLGAGDEVGGTRLDLVGQVVPGDPVEFDLELRGEQVHVPTLQAYGDLVGEDDSPVGSGAVQGSASGSDTEDPPPWTGVDGTFDLLVDKLVLGDRVEITSVRAGGEVTKTRIALDTLGAAIGGGTIDGTGEMNYAAAAKLPYSLSLTLDASEIDPSAFAEARSIPVRGRFGSAIALQGQGVSPQEAIEAVYGTFRITGDKGVVTALELDEKGTMGVVGAGLLGVALNRPGLTELARVVPYFEEIRFSELVLDLERGLDGRVDLNTLRVVGENLRVEGSGSLMASKLSQAMTAPMDLTLNLASKGRMADSLEALGLLQEEAGDDGFRSWSRELRIGGSLSDPDTAEIERFLAGAATRAALKKPAPDSSSGGDGSEGSSGGSELNESRPLTEDEIRARQIEQGLRALESLF